MKVIDAIGNRLLYVEQKVRLKKETIISLCKENKCDGLFNFDAKKKILCYWDCDGFQNYCGNAARVLPMVLNVETIFFSQESQKGELIPCCSWKDSDGLYSTTIEVQNFKKTRSGYFSAYVGNYQAVRFVTLDEFERAEEIVKGLVTDKKPPIYSFIVLDGIERDRPKVKVRVFEEFGAETMSCCSSASVVTKVLSITFPEKMGFLLKYKGGVFQTRYFNTYEQSIMHTFVDVKGEAKWEREN